MTYSKLFINAMKKPYKILPFLILALLILPSLLFAGQYKVLRVVDGDTIVIKYQGTLEKVRMLCVNTPESVHPDKKQNIPMGKTASNYTKKRLKGRYVDLEFEGPLRGNYNRLLSYIMVDGKNFNLELVRQGLSPYYTKHGLSKKYDQEFRDAERYARNHKLHIWGDPDLTQKYLRLKSKWGQSRSKASSFIVQTKEWNYVASRNSKVFHRADAKCVKTISPHNLIGFKSREEAIASGRRPCKACRP
jgi:micrococcal nuclease